MIVKSIYIVARGVRFRTIYLYRVVGRIIYVYIHFSQVVYNIRDLRLYVHVFYTYYAVDLQ